MDTSSLSPAAGILSVILSIVMAIWQDLRYGLRLVRRNPRFSTVAVLTLGLGIGANCAMFTVLNVILLRALPYKNAGRIVALWQSNSRGALNRQLVSVPDYFDWKEQNQVFDGMAAWTFQYFNLTGADEPERVEGFKVTADFFPILGVDAALGRALLPEEEQRGRDHVVILSDGLWRRRFGSDPTIVGRSVMVEGEPYTVVGVLPRDFRLFRVLNRELDVYVTQALDRARADRSDHLLFVYARLRPGVSLEPAQAAMDAISSGIAQRYPDTSAGWSAEVVELHRQWTESIRQGLLLLQAAVGFVLLIGCANITNLLLAQAAGRQREMAIRAALGAGRLRLVRQLLAESLVLGVLGGAVGTTLAVLLTALLNRLPYTALNRVEPFRVDSTVLAFSLGMALLTGVAVRLAPALQCSTENLKPDGSRRRRLRSLLVVSEAALAVMLLAAAGLLIRSSLLVAGMNRGLDPRNVLTAQTGCRGPDIAPEIAMVLSWRGSGGRLWRESARCPVSSPRVRSVFPRFQSSRRTWAFGWRAGPCRVRERSHGCSIGSSARGISRPWPFHCCREGRSRTRTTLRRTAW